MNNGNGEVTLHNVTINKRGEKVYHIWEDQPVSPINMIFRYDYFSQDKEAAPVGYRGISTKIVYKSVNFSELSPVELACAKANLIDVFKGQAARTNPYYLSVVNIGDVDNPRWYPLPLLFAPMRDQIETNNARGYDPLPKQRLFDLKQEIFDYFNYSE